MREYQRDGSWISPRSEPGRFENTCGTDQQFRLQLCAPNESNTGSENASGTDQCVPTRFSGMNRWNLRSGNASGTARGFRLPPITVGMPSERIRYVLTNPVSRKRKIPAEWLLNFAELVHRVLRVLHVWECLRDSLEVSTAHWPIRGGSHAIAKCLRNRLKVSTRRLRIGIMGFRAHGNACETVQGFRLAATASACGYQISENASGTARRFRPALPLNVAMPAR